MLEKNLPNSYNNAFPLESVRKKIFRFKKFDNFVSFASLKIKIYNEIMGLH